MKIYIDKSNKGNLVTVMENGAGHKDYEDKRIIPKLDARIEQAQDAIERLKIDIVNYTELKKKATYFQKVCDLDFKREDNIKRIIKEIPQINDKIHYRILDHGDYSSTQCGIGINNKYVTCDENKVTCKNCIRSLKSN